MCGCHKVMEIQRDNGKISWVCPIDNTSTKNLLEGPIYTVVSREAINEFVSYHETKMYYEQVYRPAHGIVNRVHRKGWLPKEEK